jgi:hypothetical protein
MPLQNRVTPFGEIVAISQRGMFTGNHGIIHDPPTKTLLTRRWASKRWLICCCEYKGRRRAVMANRSWTESFFLDEAVALAAGHRPCFLCRRKAAERFRNAWQAPEARRALLPKRSTPSCISNGSMSAAAGDFPVRRPEARSPREEGLPQAWRYCCLGRCVAPLLPRRARAEGRSSRDCWTHAPQPDAPTRALAPLYGLKTRFGVPFALSCANYLDHSHGRCADVGSCLSRRLID